MGDVVTFDDYLKGIVIRTVEILRPMPGDIVAVSVGDVRLNQQQIYNLGTAIKLLLPDGIKVGVLHDGMKLQIIRPESDQT